jgi:predicted nuclease with TOPRIM domain
MENNKDWFINEYSEIHDNLSKLEVEIDEHIKNKIYLLDKGEVLDGLKKRAQEEIERLNKTRENERRIFNYKGI